MTKMTRLIISLFLSLFALSACTGDGSTNGPGRGVFRIGVFESNKIPYRMLDSVNALRVASGLQPLELSAELTAAAATHSRDMSIQNRPWHFGSDGSSPIDRVARAGYPGVMLGENISETFESDVETLAAWMSDPATRDVIMNPDARFMGLSWYQEPGGKIWWTQIFGS
ncbi:MAG: CAP domain-containing protein [Rhodobacteraceae bacterium]|nr:CAP domain-containing protein [Paracoccaceae bacterium]